MDLEPHRVWYVQIKCKKGPLSFYVITESFLQNASGLREAKADLTRERNGQTVMQTKLACATSQVRRQDSTYTVRPVSMKSIFDGSISLPSGPITLSKFSAQRKVAMLMCRDCMAKFWPTQILWSWSSWVFNALDLKLFLPSAKAKRSMSKVVRVFCYVSFQEALWAKFIEVWIYFWVSVACHKSVHTIRDHNREIRLAYASTWRRDVWNEFRV